jgi:hypothetical protein
MLQTLLAFLTAHMAFTGTLSIWVALSTIVNLLLAVKGPAAWVAYAEQNPTIALVVNVLFRDFGIDLVGVIQHVQAWLALRAQANSGAKKQP